MIEYDTVSKELVVKKDGAVVENVSCLDFYRSYDYDNDDYVKTNKFRMNLSQDTRDSENKISERIVSMAKMFDSEYKNEN